MLLKWMCHKVHPFWIFWMSYIVSVSYSILKKVVLEALVDEIEGLCC